jgi:hypothetical protein
MSSNEIETDMDHWPEFTDKEAVEHLNLLRSRLTVDIATKLCYVSPINSFYYSEILHNERVMEPYLQLLLDILRLVPHSTFLCMFPKGCGGCAIFQFYAIAALNPSLDSVVKSLLKELLFDEQEQILSMLPEVNQMAVMIKQDYKRREDPFPYVANCFDLGKKNQESKIVGALGAMIRSEKFLDLMKNHDERAIKVAKEMIDDDKETFDFGFSLDSLLKKYLND